MEKRFWTAGEDETLRAYVSEHGRKNWNDVARNTGLSRSGKSCRFRWFHYLSPNLKKVSFTKEEEDQIVQLHFTHGPKWARMATQLSGRTDNEIKNFWHTRLKRCIRLRLPIYPPELQAQAAATQTLLNAHQNFFERHILFMQDMNIYYRKRQRETEAEGLYIAGMNMKIQKRLRETEAANPFLGGYAMNAQSDQLRRNLLIGSSSQHFSPFLGNATYGSTSRLPSLQSGPQQSNPMRILAPVNNFVQYPETNQAPSNRGIQQSNVASELRVDNSFVQAPMRDQAPSSVWRTQQPIPISGPQQFNHMPILEPGNNFVQTNQTPSNRGTQQSNVVSKLGLDNTLVHTPMRDQAPSLNPVSELEPDKTCDGLMLESLDLDFPLDDTLIGYDFGIETDFDLDGMLNNTFVQAPMSDHEPAFGGTQQYTTRSGIQFPLEEQTTSEFMSTLDDQLLKPFDKQFPLGHFEDTPVDTNTEGNDFSIDDFDVDGMPK